MASLAAADLHAVLMLWEGLGYYARARNLHKAARQNVASGQPPQSRAELQEYPGIGPYTSRAIASIVFGEPCAAVDGNVRRVLARLHAIEGTSASELQAMADELLDPGRPGDYNQAVMELGAKLCTPRKPACPQCPVQQHCQAFAYDTPEAWPVRRKKGQIPHYDVAVGLLIDTLGRIFIQRRPQEGLLGGLWELPGGKRIAGEAITGTCKRELREELGIEVIVEDLAGKIDHAYTHFRITLWAYHCRIVRGTPISAQGLETKWIRPEDLIHYPFPRANRRILELLSNSKSSRR